MSLLSLVCTGCLFLPGPEALKRIESQRPEVPYARVVFRTEPGEGEHSLAELRSTLEFWTARGVDGEPRWRSVLVPKPEDLYTQLLAAIDSGEADVMTLVSYKYDTAGTDDITLVDYIASGDRLVGYDHLDRITPPPRPSRGTFVGYDDMRWWEYALLVLDLPVYLAMPSFSRPETSLPMILSVYSTLACQFFARSCRKRSSRVFVVSGVLKN